MDTRAVAGSRPVLRRSTACVAELPCTDMLCSSAKAAHYVKQLIISHKCQASRPL